MRCDRRKELAPGVSLCHPQIPCAVLPAVSAPCVGASRTPDVGNLVAGRWGSELTGASWRSVARLQSMAAPCSRGQWVPCACVTGERVKRCKIPFPAITAEGGGWACHPVVSRAQGCGVLIGQHAFARVASL